MRTTDHISTNQKKPSIRQAFAIRMVTLLWRGRAQSWDEHGSAQLGKVVDAVLASCSIAEGKVAVDLGCGSGQVTLPLAQSCARVLAVDVSAEAISILEERARREGISSIQALAHPIETLDLEPESVDLVVSNYALHHLRDVDKHEVLARAYSWLRPGGRLVIGDMMFGRGGDPEDRDIIRSKLRALAARGPGGWWRILKNAWRFLLRFQEKPLTAAAWESIAHEAGFADVRTTRVVAEARVLSAKKRSVYSRVEMTNGAATRSGIDAEALPLR